MKFSDIVMSRFQKSMGKTYGPSLTHLKKTPSWNIQNGIFAVSTRTKRRAWTFFDQKYLKESDTYQKPNIISLQRIAFFNAS